MSSALTEGLEIRVDHAALRVNQIFIIGLLLGAFVADSVWLAAFVALVMLAGTAEPRLALFKQIYRYVLKDRFVQPDVVPGPSQPHRFAQGFGGIVLFAAVVSLAVGAAIVGWGLVGVVIGLAAVNLLLGFCVGCFFYYRLARLGVPGFSDR